MNIDFSKYDETLVHSPRGGQGTFGMRQYQTRDNRILKGRLLPGSAFGMHAHETNSETMIFLSGQGKMVSPEGEERVFPGAVSHCPRGSAHCLVNDGEEDLVFIALIPEHGAENQ